MSINDMKKEFLQNHFRRQREIDAQSRETTAKMASANMDLILQSGTANLQPKKSLQLMQLEAMDQVRKAVGEVPDGGQTDVP